jgi:hypothetical protein
VNLRYNCIPVFLRYHCDAVNEAHENVVRARNGDARKRLPAPVAVGHAHGAHLAAPNALFNEVVELNLRVGGCDERRDVTGKSRRFGAASSTIRRRVSFRHDSTQ